MKIPVSDDEFRAFLAFRSTHHDKPGMSLRDYFAAAALRGMLSHDGWRDWGQPNGLAKASYGFADAMLAERDKRE